MFLHPKQAFGLFAEKQRVCLDPRVIRLMNPTLRERILAAARDLGPEPFNQLIASVRDTRRTVAGLRFWQKELIADLVGFDSPPITTPAEFVAVFSGVRYLPTPTTLEPLSLAAFWACPTFWYRQNGVHIRDEWIVEAWEQLPRFRRDLAAAFARIAGDEGGRHWLADHLEYLDAILARPHLLALRDAMLAEVPSLAGEVGLLFDRLFAKLTPSSPTAIVEVTELYRYSHPSPWHFAHNFGEDYDGDIPF